MDVDAGDVDAAAKPLVLEHDVAHRTVISLLQREAVAAGGPISSAFSNLVAGHVDVWCGARTAARSSSKGSRPATEGAKTELLGHRRSSRTRQGHAGHAALLEALA
jgi:hypothetical protein